MYMRRVTLELFKISSYSLAYLSQEHIVRLVLDGHQHDKNPVEELKTL